MIMMFEDNPKSPVSECLSSSCVGEVFRFTGGSANLHKAITEIDDEVYVFVDLVLDNAETITTYSELVRIFHKNMSVHIIPIPCIEYYVVHFLHDLGLLENKYYDYSLKTFNYRSFIDKAFGTIPDSVEVFYKALLNTSRYICTRNSRKSKSPGMGVFYMSDCNCTNYCNNLCNKRIEDKANLLVSYLPVCPFDSVMMEKLKVLGRVGYAITLEELLLLQKTLYSKMKKDLDLNTQ